MERCAEVELIWVKIWQHRVSLALVVSKLQGVAPIMLLVPTRVFVACSPFIRYHCLLKGFGEPMPYTHRYGSLSAFTREFLRDKGLLTLDAPRCEVSYEGKGAKTVSPFFADLKESKDVGFFHSSGLETMYGGEEGVLPLAHLMDREGSPCLSSRWAVAQVYSMRLFGLKYDNIPRLSDLISYAGQWMEKSGGPSLTYALRNVNPSVRLDDFSQWLPLLEDISLRATVFPFAECCIVDDRFWQLAALYSFKLVMGLGKKQRGFFLALVQRRPAVLLFPEMVRFHLSLHCAILANIATPSITLGCWKEVLRLPMCYHHEDSTTLKLQQLLNPEGDDTGLARALMYTQREFSSCRRSGKAFYMCSKKAVNVWKRRSPLEELAFITNGIVRAPIWSITIEARALEIVLSDLGKEKIKFYDYDKGSVCLHSEEHYTSELIKEVKHVVPKFICVSPDEATTRRLRLKTVKNVCTLDTICQAVDASGEGCAVLVIRSDTLSAFQLVWLFENIVVKREKCLFLGGIRSGGLDVHLCSCWEAMVPRVDESQVLRPRSQSPWPTHSGRFATFFRKVCAGTVVEGDIQSIVYTEGNAFNFIKTHSGRYVRNNWQVFWAGNMGKPPLDLVGDYKSFIGRISVGMEVFVEDVGHGIRIMECGTMAYKSFNTKDDCNCHNPSSVVRYNIFGDDKQTPTIAQTVEERMTNHHQICCGISRKGFLRPSNHIISDAIIVPIGKCRGFFTIKGLLLCYPGTRWKDIYRFYLMHKGDGRILLCGGFTAQDLLSAVQAGAPPLGERSTLFLTPPSRSDHDKSEMPGLNKDGVLELEA